MADKLNTYLKRTLYVIIGLIMFGPLFFWKGGDKPPQEIMGDGMYPRRYGGMAMSRPPEQYQQQQDPRMYQQQMDMRHMNPPGYTVTGKIVYD